MNEQKISAALPGWKAVRMLGRGSYGYVYEIERDQFGVKEKAALKLLTIPQDQSVIDELYNDGYEDASVAERMDDELQELVKEYYVMAELKGHTNIVNCNELTYLKHSGDPGYDVFIRMELLTPLTVVVGKAYNAKTAEATALKLGKDICRALMLCEKKNIVHRDIKPQNLFLSEFGDYKLGDFGIARTMEHTMGGTRTGTYKYMAPEVYQSRPYGHKADIYSLGLVLYWLLNEKRMPFLPLPPVVPSASAEDEARTKRFQGVLLPAPKNGSEALKNAVRKACAYDPKDRFASAEEMLEALKQAEGGRKTEALHTAQNSAGQSSDTAAARTDALNNVRPGKSSAGTQSKKADAGSEGRDGRILGIYFGVTEVYVSYLMRGVAVKVLSIPAYVTVTEVGEVLAGDRAERYRKYHADAPLYSVLETMRQGKWKKAAKISCRGMKIYALRMCDCLMQELRRQLNRTEYYGTVRECVLSMPSFSYLFMEYMQGIMARAGFLVKRILTASAACGLYLAYAKREDEWKQYFVCAVSGDVLECCLEEYGQGVAEMVYKFEHPLRKGGGLSVHDVVADARQEMRKVLRRQFGAGDYEELNAECYFFAEGNSVASGAEVGALCVFAAAGAAVQGAKISGNAATEDILLLDCTGAAYGLEVTDASGQMLQELQWVIEENTTLPTKNSITYDRKKAGKNTEELLTLYIGHTYESDFSETISVNTEALLSIMRAADSVELFLDLNTFSSAVEISVTDPESKKKASTSVSLSTTRVPIAAKSREIDRKELLKNAWAMMSTFYDALVRLPSSEQNSPTVQGMRQVEKQCRAFLGKRGLSYDKTPGNLSGESADADLLYELLEIVDNLEYGLRSRSNSVLGAADIMLSTTYFGLQKALEEHAGVRPVEAEGCMFDVNRHSAVSYETVANMTNLAVIGEVRRGYFWGEELLRPAIVRVAK